MPETLPAVWELVRQLSTRKLSPVTLLVVPGRPWKEDEITALRELQEHGVAFAGHGWNHHADGISGLWHRMHSALLSRQSGEHLSLDPLQIDALISHCHAWFRDSGLGAPELYVPPAWAMGDIGRGQLKRLPFRQYEHLSGVYDATTDRFTHLPLMGFEADPPWRAPLLRLSNAANLKLARARRPVRIGIHPRDLSLPLAPDLLALLDLPLSCRGYQDLNETSRRP